MSLSLSELQANIAQVLRGEAVSVPLNRCVQSTPTLNAETRLAIYRNSFTSALQQILHQIFPICEQIVGVDFFRAMSLKYIQNTPSRSPDIDDYGMYFADFVQTFLPLAHLPYLAEMARAEWAWHIALRASDSVGLTIEQLQALDSKDYARLRVQLSASSTLLACQFPIVKIWKMHQADATPTACLQLPEGGVNLLIWRQGNTVRMSGLDEIEWFLCQMIAQFCTISALFERLPPEWDSNEIYGVLLQFVNDGAVIVDLELFSQ